MFHRSSKLRYTVKVDTPDPQLAQLLQQTIGEVNDGVRVAMQYFFHATGARGDFKYRDILMMTAAEEFLHIEFPVHAVALNLENASVTAQEEAAKNPLVNAALGGVNPRHLVSSSLSAMPEDANGLAFDISHVGETCSRHDGKRHGRRQWPGSGLAPVQRERLQFRSPRPSSRKYRMMYCTIVTAWSNRRRISAAKGPRVALALPHCVGGGGQGVSYFPTDLATFYSNQRRRS